jgi:hypothetical protein
MQCSPKTVKRPGEDIFKLCTRSQMLLGPIYSNNFEQAVAQALFNVVRPHRPSLNPVPRYIEAATHQSNLALVEVTQILTSKSPPALYQCSSMRPTTSIVFHPSPVPPFPFLQAYVSEDKGPERQS